MTLRIALVIPPMTNFNAPYASLPRLTGWLRTLGHQVDQHDLSLQLIRRCLSRAGLERLFDAVDPASLSPELAAVHANRDRYVAAIDSVVAFLQGKQPELAFRLLNPRFVPEGPTLGWRSENARRASFGRNGIADRAGFVATAVICDLCLLFHTVSPDFGIYQYGAELANSASSFDGLAARLAAPPDPIESILWELAAEVFPEDLDLVGITCPFPGNLMGTLRIGQWLRRHRPRCRIAVGGGYPSTELRQITDPRPFELIDYLVVDDGEFPLERICAHLTDPGVTLSSTFTCESGAVTFHPAVTGAPRFRDLPVPDYDGIELDDYIDLLSAVIPAYRLWNTGRWLKLTAAHGCYWKRCTFCDVHLSYIGDFDPMPAAAIVDQMDALHAQTGRTGFHFTDEAFPPPLMVSMALELLRRGRAYHFWGNIRFDPGFTPDRCRLLAAAGLVAVTGGLEVANDRVLGLIDKGITVPQAAKVMQAFATAGVLVHAYLMYGFPGETLQDTIDALEVVRQLMKAGVLQSGGVHSFTPTAHSPVARDPARFGIRLATGFQGFAYYTLARAQEPAHTLSPELQRERQERRQREAYVAAGVRGALQSYMAGSRLDAPLGELFAGPVPTPTVEADRIATILAADLPPGKPPQRICWLGGRPTWRDGTLRVPDARGVPVTLEISEEVAAALERCLPTGWRDGQPPRIDELTRVPELERLRAAGLALI